MTIFGVSVAELAALFGVLSLLAAALTKFYTMFRNHISAPLIEALDNLRAEISQLEHYLEREYQELNSRVLHLSERLIEMEKRPWEWVKDENYRVVNKG